MQPSYKHGILGGTFDHFHKGHEHFLDTALKNADSLTIGISTKKLYAKKVLAKHIQPLALRKRALTTYLKKRNVEKRVKIITIDDFYGTSLLDKSIDCIFVTEVNIKTAKIINNERILRQFQELTIITVPLLKAMDRNVIASERIRKGEIKRDGFVYTSLFKNSLLQISEAGKETLREPLGTIIHDLSAIRNRLKKAPAIISVGDATTLSLLHAQIHPDIVVIDFKTRRHDLTQQEQEQLQQMNTNVMSYHNKAGLLEQEASLALKHHVDRFLASHKQQTIHIVGEEDLLTLPAVLFAPLHAIILYGQYQKGIIAIPVSEKKKRKIMRLLRDCFTHNNTV